nr:MULTISPECIES: DNA-deoxyinosine glycosylase [Methylotenera]
MPGLASLKANQYYAHPRNSFWRIVADIYGFNAESEYNIRVQNLKVSGIAVWDVLQSCERSGSLDSAIISGSRICNDFELFFEQHPHIKLIAFNGSEAEKSFNQFILPKMGLREFNYSRLPSSSPAHTQALEQKIAAWRKSLLVD